jgi:hypothetical protein
METLQTTTGKTVRGIKWAVIGAFVILLNLFFTYTISLVLVAPTWDGYCPMETYNKNYTDKAMCVADGGKWTENTAPQAPRIDEKTPAVHPVEVSGYCDATYTCQKVFMQTQSVYNRNIFIILVILGVVSLVGAWYLKRFSTVALGLALGGVLALIVGSVRYWSDMHDAVRVLVLAVALGTLVWVGVKKIQE